jgi:hypothetical protein
VEPKRIGARAGDHYTKRRAIRDLGRRQAANSNIAVKDLQSGEVTSVAFRPQKCGGENEHALDALHPGRFHRHGPDIEPVKLKSRREAKDWCAEHHSDPFIKEIGADSVRRRDQGQGTGGRMTC